MLGLIPVFITAGFIEGFFTRLTDLPDVFRGAFIFMCFAFVGLYFWWYPWRKFRDIPVSPYDPDQLIPQLDQPVEIHILRKTREVFTTSFVLFRKLFLKALSLAAGLGIAYTLIFWIIGRAEATENIEFKNFSVGNLSQFHSYSNFPILFFPNLLFISAVILGAFYFFRNELSDKLSTSLKINWKLFGKIVLITTIFELCLLSGNGLVASVGIVAIPFLMFWMVISAIEGTSLPNSFGRMLILLNGTKRHIFVSFFFLAIISLLIIFLIDSPFTWFYITVLQWNVEGDPGFKQHLAELALMFLNQVGIGIIIPLILSGQILEYYSSVEAREANDLRIRVEKIGVKRRAYGMERE